MPTLYDNFSQVRQYIDENNTSYVTKTELANASYVTSADLPVIDENIIPKENNTYTLGDSSYLYAATYTDAVYYNTNNKIYNTANSGLVVQRAGIDICGFLGGGNIGIAPLQSNSKLGNNSMFWQATYTTGLYFRDNNNSLYSAGNYTIGCKINGLLRYSFMAGSIKPEQSNVDLGTSSAKWNATYTSNLYADNIHNFIWTGTAAEYAALSDYTTYQLYLIENE